MNLKGKLIVSAHKAFIILDPSNGDYSIFAKRNQFYHWGITWSDRHLFTCIWLDRRTIILGYRKEDLKREITISPPQKFNIISSHQICWIDGRIWISNTHFDCCTILDPYTEKYETWNMFNPKIYKDRRRDHHHMNGLWYYDGHIYVIAHNKKKPSFVQVHKYPSLKLVDKIEMGLNIHNLWPEGDELLTCSSKDARIISNKRGEVVKTGGFPRGVSITKDYNYIGISPHFSHHCKHMRRTHIDGEVRVYNKNWELIRTFVMRDFGQVYEVRMFGERDVSHWPGSENIDFNFTKSLISPVGECYRIVNDSGRLNVG